MKQKRNAESYDVLKILGKNIQKSRTDRNISIKELSEKTGIREKYIIKIEKGEAIGMTTGHLFKIADALNEKIYILVKSI